MAGKSPASPPPSRQHKPRRLWTSELVVAAIQQRAGNGQALNAHAMNSEHCDFFRTGRWHLKRWCIALREAGGNLADDQLVTG